MSEAFFDEVRRAIALLKDHGLYSWADRFEEAMAGSTGGEILMAIRYQSQEFLSERPTDDSSVIVRIAGLNQQSSAALE